MLSKKQKHKRKKIKENDFLIQIRVAKVGKWSKSLKKKTKQSKTNLGRIMGICSIFHLKFTTFNQFYDLQIV